MSARPQDIARLEAMERRKSHRHDSHRAKMLCRDCTLTPEVPSNAARASELLVLADASVMSTAQVLELLHTELGATVYRPGVIQ